MGAKDGVTHSAAFAAAHRAAHRAALAAAHRAALAATHRVALAGAAFGATHSNAHLDATDGATNSCAHLERSANSANGLADSRFSALCSPCTSAGGDCCAKRCSVFQQQFNWHVVFISYNVGCVHRAVDRTLCGTHCRADR